MSWETIAGILGAIVLVGNVGAVIYKCIKPALQTREIIKDLQQQTSDIRRHEEKDLRRLEHMEEMSKLLCMSQVCIMNHMIDGNNVDKMKQTREDLQDLLCKL